MKNIKIVIFFILCLGFFLIKAQSVVAAGCCIDYGSTPPRYTTASSEAGCVGPDTDFVPTACPGSTDSRPGFGSAGGFAKEAAGTAGVDTQSTLESRVASIVNCLLSLIGIIFLMLMVYGGYIWMIARGDEAEATKAKNIITMGVIGMAIVIAAYAITFFVVQRLIAGAS
jgi:hypothetical protein